MAVAINSSCVAVAVVGGRWGRMWTRCKWRLINKPLHHRTPTCPSLVRSLFHFMCLTIVTYISYITLIPFLCLYILSGVDPARKGTGAGGALLKHHLARKFDWVLSDLTGAEQDSSIVNSITTATIVPVIALLTIDPTNAVLPQSNLTAPNQLPSQIPVLALWTSDPANVGFYEKYGLTVYSVCTVDGVDRAWWMTNGRGRI